MEEIVELAESGIRYTQMPHVMEVILPMLCSYMSHWWEHGPENSHNKSEMCCTALTSDDMNTLLGNILKIIHNNLGIDEGAWMKRLAGRRKFWFIFTCILKYIYIKKPIKAKPANFNKSIALFKKVK